MEFRMSAEADIPIGKYGNARVVKIYAAVSNTDLNSWNFGSPIDYAYYLTRADAELGTNRIGPMGSNGRVQDRYAIKFDDGTYYLLAENGSAIPAKGTPEIKLDSIGEMGDSD